MNKKHFDQKGWLPEKMGSLDGKTFVVTGANTGVGFEATKILLSKGASVIMLNRNVEKSKAASASLAQYVHSNSQLRFVQMDLADLTSVRQAAEQVKQLTPRIDALICNAAIAQVAKHTLTVDGFESQLGVNHYGHFLLCELLFNAIESAAGRIVVIGSEGYKMGLKTIQFDDMNWNKNYHPHKTYCHSKLAQVYFAYELQRRVDKHGLSTKVYVCHPGASKTSLINENASRVTRFLFSIMATLPIVQTAEQGAYPALMCATEPSLPQRAYYGPTGTMNWVGPVDSCDVESFVWDENIAKKLWEVSALATQSKWQI